jgi:hypothetical protein
MSMTRATSLSAALLVATFGAPNLVGAQGHDVRAALQYQWLHLPGTSFPAGVSGEVSAIVRTPFVVLADVGWASKDTHSADLSTTARIIDFGAGLRLMPAVSPFRPFVQLIGGGINLDVRGTVGAVSGRGSETWFQLEPGAGFHVDIGLKTAIAASVHVRRVFLDRTVFEAPGDTEFRALIGVSVQLAN